MKLSDVMGAADLSIYAEVGLVLFLVGFLAVVFRVLVLGRAEVYEEVVRMPLQDDAQEQSTVSTLSLTKEPS